MSLLHPGAPGHNDPTVLELRGLSTLQEQERWDLNFQRANRSGKPEHLPF